MAAQTAAKTSRLSSAASTYQAGSSAAQATGAAAAHRASEAAVRAALAAVAQAQINLDHATIVSPVDGTVIQRNVSVGQTVAAALQAPTLFTIAKDLTKMELDIAVGEPDVGAVHPGQRVAFSVLAYPGRIFASTVNEVRQNPTIINNVTTYDTVAYPNNRDAALRPGMTANVQITIATYPDATIVPLAALQWRPSAAIAKTYRLVAPPVAGEGIPAASSAWGATGEAASFAVSVGSSSRCYVLDERNLRGVAVNVLAIDGTRAGVRVVSGALHAQRPRHRRLSMTPTIETHELSRLFPAGKTFVAAVDRITFVLQPGEFVAIMGPSGSGKSTFMNIIGCLDRASIGHLRTRWHRRFEATTTSSPACAGRSSDSSFSNTICCRVPRRSKMPNCR